MHIKDSVFVVAGAASGLGAATVAMLAAAGANVVIADLNAEQGEKVAEESGGQVAFSRTDVAEEASVRATYQVALDRFGALHGVINCAGILGSEKVLGSKGVHRLESFARTIQVNLIGAFNLIRLAADIMSKATPNAEGERGVIINTASIAAFEGQIGQAAYAASKGGVIGMTLPIARELARYGIRIMSIAPGTFETPMLAALSPEMRDALGAETPFPPRLGRPQEFASMVRHIIENVMLNGSVIRLDGALRMTAK